MIYLKKHRVIKEIDKMRARGAVVHFLTGDGIRDNFYYGVRRGIKSLPDTLGDYYLSCEEPYDFFIRITSGTNNPECWKKADNGKREEVSFDEIMKKPERKGPFERSTKKKAENTDIQKAAEDAAQEAGSSTDAIIGRLGEVVKKGDKRIIILLENLEWIAKLYEAQPDTNWIAAIRDWEKYRNIMTVITIADMKLLEKYSFKEDESLFIGCPSVEEIGYSYLRYLLMNTAPNYTLDMKALDEVSHGMSVGRKKLRECMNVLRSVLAAHPDKFSVDDFKDSIERGIDTPATLEKVHVNKTELDTIISSVVKFLDGEENAPKGVLMYGPPGTGKTLIAKAIANEMHCHFMAPTLADMKAEFVGQSSANIKRIFQEARANEPTIIFIDEADTVFPSRSLGSSDRDSFGMDMVNQFLQEVDGAKTDRQRVFIIAATNRREAVDPALISRLGKPILIDLPSKENRRLIFEDNFNFSLKGKRFEEYLLTKSEKMSGRDIKNFANVVKRAVKKEGGVFGDNQVTDNIIHKSFEQEEFRFIREMVDKGIFSAENIVPPDENKSRIDDIIGYENVKEQIAAQVSYITEPAERRALRQHLDVDALRGVLLYGSPGNGKSELVKAIAGTYGFYFFKVLSRDFSSTFATDQIKRLDDIFSNIMRFSKMTDKAGIVLFFDEFDSLAGKNVLHQVVRGSLLNYIASTEGLRNPNSKIVFIAATNNEADIDDAIKRPGRIDFHMEMPCPSEDEAVAMLSRFIERDPKVANIDEALSRSLCEKLRGETREKFVIRKFGTLEWDKLIADEKIRAGIQQEIEAQRPSGADIKTLFNVLKDIAFREDSIADDSVGKKILIIDEKVAEKRFPAQQKEAGHGDLGKRGRKS